MSADSRPDPALPRPESAASRRIGLARIWLPAVLLGIATIGSYGIAQYSIGILLPVIAPETGWSIGTLSAGYSLGLVGQGAVALLAGRTFDRHGSRPVLFPAMLAGSSLLVLSSFAQESLHFVLAWAAGAACIGGGLFYSMTMPVTARLYPDRRVAAFSVLTLLGALAGPVFYPIAGWLIEMWGWRAAIRLLVAVMLACIAPAALLVRSPAATSASHDPRAGISLPRVIRDPAVHRTLLVLALSAMANSAVLLHQVGVMEAAGMSIAAASGFAGARGFCQIGGRLLLSALTSRFGTRGSMAISYFAGSTATLSLLAAYYMATPALAAVYFALMGGMAFGLLSPLHGLFQAQVYGDARLGTLTGVGVVLGSAAGALGGWLVGLAFDATDSYRFPLVMIAGIQLMAIAALAWQRGSDRPARRGHQPHAGDVKV